MSFNYVVTSQKPTSVTQSLTGNFTSATDFNLILSKCTRIEVHLMTPDGLSPQLDLPIYGRIILMELFRPVNEDKDWLFVCTQNYQFCVLAYDTHAARVVTKASGNIKDTFSRSTDVVARGRIDPECRLIGLHLYEAYLKVIPIDSARGTLKDAFNIRLDELNVLDIQFLHGYSKPTICVLYEDSRKARHVKTYHVLLKEKELMDGPWSQSNVDAGANLLIPIPSPCGGVLIIGQQTIVYHNGSSYHAVPIQQTLIQVYGMVDKDGSRYLLADQYRQLHVVALQFSKNNSSNSKEVSGLHLETLGQTSCASSLSYLDNGYVFVGSCFGDSQLVKLNQARDEFGSYIEVIDTYANIGPIVDFCVMDLDRQGQGQIVACSGAYKDGSLRVVRNGIGINEQAAVEIPGIKGMWSLRPYSKSKFDKYLVQSFISEIRVLCMEGDEMEESEIEGFSIEKTLFCGTMADNLWIQVTERSIRLVSAESKALISSWTTPDNSQITLASANATQILITSVGGNLMYFEVEANKIIQKNQSKMTNEISCIDLTPLPPASERRGVKVEDINVEMEDACSEGSHQKLLSSSVCAIGSWTEFSVSILKLPTLEVLATSHLGGEVLPRSVLISAFENKKYLLVGLGDGHLVNYQLSEKMDELSNKKKISLGTQPITLATFITKDTSFVFASSDRPTVIYSSSNKLMYSNVNTTEVNLMCPFNSESFPECLALASEEALTIGTIDDIQKLHVQSIPLEEWPRRICHHTASRTLGVCVINFSMAENGEEIETSYVRLFDDQTFELLDSYKLDPFEQACSITRCTFADDPTNYIVVGTAFVHEEESEPHQGRILVFTVSGNQGERTLTLVSETESRGAVYCLKEFNGKLLAGVNSKTMLLKWAEKAEGEHDLFTECEHHGHILVLYLQCRGDFIIVGDLMKSLTLLSYESLDGSIQEIARDLDSNWITAVDILDEDVFIGAETDFNIFTLKRNADAASDEERGRLEIHGEYHIGEYINKFAHGSLVMQPADIESMEEARGSSSPVISASPSGGLSPEKESSTSRALSRNHSSLLFAGVSGMIGVILSVTEENFNLLERIQAAINKVVKGIGSFSHQEWRMFESRRKVNEARGFVDGDLIESFLDLSPNKMEEVVDYLNKDGKMSDEKGYTVEAVAKIIEDMSQLH